MSSTATGPKADDFSLSHFSANVSLQTVSGVIVIAIDWLVRKVSMKKRKIAESEDLEEDPRTEELSLAAGRSRDN